MDITQEMLQAAAREESEQIGQSPEILVAKNRYLNDRVILLRALVNQQQAEIEALKSKLDGGEKTEVPDEEEVRPDDPA